VSEDEAAARRRERFGALPAQVRPDDWVETVDADLRPVVADDDERERLLRLAGGGTP
jgi:hypothetical protein